MRLVTRLEHSEKKKKNLLKNVFFRLKRTISMGVKNIERPAQGSQTQIVFTFLEFSVLRTHLRGGFGD